MSFGVDIRMIDLPPDTLDSWLKVWSSCRRERCPGQIRKQLTCYSSQLFLGHLVAEECGGSCNGLRWQYPGYAGHFGRLEVVLWRNVKEEDKRTTLQRQQYSWAPPLQHCTALMHQHCITLHKHYIDLPVANVRCDGNVEFDNFTRVRVRNCGLRRQIEQL